MSANFGCVLFDGDVAQSGYYALGSLDGASSGKRFSRLNELPSDGIFLTNMGAEALMLNNLRHNAMMREDRFLRYSVDALLRQSIWHDTHPIDDAVYVGSLFHRTLAILSSMLGVEMEELKLSEWSLRHQIRQSFFPMDPDLGRKAHFVNAMIDATGYFTSVLMKSGFARSRSVPVDLRVRTIEMINLFQDIIVPYNHKVERIRSDKAPVFMSMEDMVEHMSDPSNIGIWAIRYSSMDERFAMIWNHKGSASSREMADSRKKSVRYRHLSKRNWVTSAELALIAQYADVEIIEGYRFVDGGVQMSAHPVLGKFIRFMKKVFSPAALGSHTVQVFAENALFAIPTAHKSALKDTLSVNIHAPFIWAEMRISLFNRVIRLLESDYVVSGYGGNAIRLELPDLKGDSRFAMTDLIQLQNEQGIVPYAWDLGDLTEDNKKDIFERVVRQNKKDDTMDIFVFWAWSILESSVKARLENDARIVRRFLEKIEQMGALDELPDTEDSVEGIG